MAEYSPTINQISRRQQAYLADFLLWGAFVLAVRAAFDVPVVSRENLWANVGLFATLRTALLLKDSLGGYSPGKWVYSIRIVEESSGRGIGVWQSLVRNWYLILPLVGEIVAAVELQARRKLMDRLLGLRVILVTTPMAGDSETEP